MVGRCLARVSHDYHDSYGHIDSDYAYHHYCNNDTDIFNNLSDYHNSDGHRHTDPLSDDGNEHLDCHLDCHNNPNCYDDSERDLALADVRLTRMPSGRRPSGCEDYVHRGYRGERIHARRGSHLREQRSGDLR